MKSKKVLLSGRENGQYGELISDLLKLHSLDTWPLRVGKKFDSGKKDWIIHIRPQTLPEFLYELIIAWPEEKAAREKEVFDALEHAFRPIIAAARGAAYRDAKKLEESVGRKIPTNQLESEMILDEDEPSFLPPSGAETNKNLTAEVEPQQYVAALEELLGLICKKASRVTASRKKTSQNINHFSSPKNGNLPAVTGHFYITKRSALEFTANNVIVGSVNALAAGKASASASLQRAFAAFKDGWKVAQGQCRLPSSALRPVNFPAPLSVNSKASIEMHQATLISVNGLEHIEKLICIPDSMEREHSSRFQDFGKNRWKEFYLAGCKDMKGSIVRELYPNYYCPDPENGNKKIPFYSNDNVDGAVAAAYELSSVFREDGKDPVSFMFAGLNEDAYRRIQEAWDRYLNELNFFSSDTQSSPKKKGPPMSGIVLPANVPAPERKMWEIEKINGSDRKGSSSSLLISDDEDDH